MRLLVAARIACVLAAAAAAALSVRAARTANREVLRGEAALEAGRFEEAAVEFAAAVDRRGDHAPAELLFNLSLAQLRAGSLGEAEIRAEIAAVRGGGSFLLARDAMLGAIEVRRARLFLAQALGPEAEPFAFELALDAARRGRDHFARAVSRGDGGPEHRRNAERAERLVAEIERARSAREDAPRSAEKRPPPRPDTRPEPEQAPLIAQEADNLPDAVARVLERLRRLEQEKQAMRRARRAARSALVERDW